MEQGNEKWPSIYVTEDDQHIIKNIQSKKDGPLQNMVLKDLLLLAAAIAVQEKLPPDPTKEERSKMKDIVSYANLNGQSYEEYRHYLCLIYFATQANRDISKITSPINIVRNFEDYAHRGIGFLEREYLNAADGDDRIYTDFIRRINRSRE